MLAAVHRAGCVRWDLADVGPVLQLMADLQQHGMLPQAQSSRASTDILKTSARQLRQLGQRHQSESHVRVLRCVCVCGGEGEMRGGGGGGDASACWQIVHDVLMVLPCIILPSWRQ